MIGAGRRGLLVEVRLYGARLGAVQAAVSEIERLARRHQAGLWVVDAVLIEHALDHDHRTRYQVREQDANASGRSFSLRALRRALTSLRIVVLPGRPDLDVVSERLEQGGLTGRQLDPQRHQIRVPPGWEGRDAGGPQPAPPVSTWRIALPVIGGLFLALASGFTLAAFEGISLLAPILVVMLLVWPVGRSIIGSGENRPLRLQLGWGAVVVAMMTLFGYMLALVVPGPLPEVARVTTYAAAGLALFLFILYGLSYALFHTWFIRNANWAVPALIPALALSLPWFGGLLHTVYLRTAFDIPADAVTVSLYWRYLASFKPLGLALAVAALMAAIAGWMRHYHQWGNSRGMVTVMVPVVSLVVLGFSGLAGMTEAQVDAGRAWQTARDGKVPAPYYGLEAELVCVTPVDKGIPVFNGPLDSKRALLTFGPTSDRIWLWDPRRTESLSVRLEDVAVTEGEGGRCD
jgi:hypothetical protein